MKGIEDLQIERPHEDDFLAAAKIVQKTVLDTYSGITPELTPQALRFHVSGDWLEKKAEAIRHEVEAGTSEMRVARLSELVVGCCLVKSDGQGGQLAVDPDHQGGVVGLALMLAATDSLDQGRNLTISTVPGTLAEKLYESLGFVPADRNFADESPVLRGGEVLPLREFTISAERIEESRKRVSLLLAKRGLLLSKKSAL